MRTPAVLALALLAAATPLAAQQEVPDSIAARQPRQLRLERELERLAPGDSVRGTLGVSVLHLESGRYANVRARERFPMASTYKVPIAATLLRRVDQGTLRLDSLVAIQPWDLHPGSGTLSSTFPRGGLQVSVRNLLELMLLISDNSATDLVLRTAGGPAAVKERLREARIDGLSVDRPTIELIADAVGIAALPADTLRTLARFDSLVATVSDSAQDAAARRLLKDPRDATTPEAMVRVLEAIWRRRLLREETTRLLLDIMTRCQTGAGRIKGMLPDSTVVAHKTGTLTLGVTNDVGIVTLPGTLGHFAIAIYLKGSKLDEAARERLLAQVARAAYDYFVFTPVRATP